MELQTAASMAGLSAGPKDAHSADWMAGKWARSSVVSLAAMRAVGRVAHWAVRRADWMVVSWARSMAAP